MPPVKAELPYVVPLDPRSLSRPALFASLPRSAEPSHPSRAERSHQERTASEGTDFELWEEKALFSGLRETSA